jgi:xanthine dehydrogenase accessory factor
MQEENIIKILNRAIEERKSAAFVTVISVDGSTPRESGAKMIVYENGSIDGTIGGGSFEALAIRKAVECLKKGVGGKFIFDLTPKGIGALCMGKMEIFIDVYKAPLKVFILGGGHVAKKVAEVLDVAGFPYFIADERKEFANRNNFPNAIEIINEYPNKSFKKALIDEDTYIVIMTRGHILDKECLIEAVKTKAKYIGMIGRADKVKQIMDSLKKKGIKIDDRVYSPIGLDLGGKTPGEIAVSVISEIIKIRYNKTGRHMRDLFHKTK